MFKFLAFLVLMGVAIVGGANEPVQEGRTLELQSEIQKKVTLPLACGFLKLKLMMAEEAMVEFSSALDNLGHLTRKQEALEAIAMFGLIIAYDILGDHEKCKLAIGSLCLLLFENFSEREDGWYTGEMKRKSSEGKSWAMIRDLVKLAPSEQVRDLLEAFLDELEGYSSSEIGLLHPNSVEYEWSYVTISKVASIQLCKFSWKKTLKKIQDGFDYLENLLDKVVNIALKVESVIE